MPVFFVFTICSFYFVGGGGFGSALLLPPWGGKYNHEGQWFIALFLISLFIAKAVLDRIGWQAALAFSYSVFSGMLLFLVSFNAYYEDSVSFQSVTKIFSSIATFSIVLITVFCLLLKKGDTEKLLRAYSFFPLVDGLVILIQFFIQPFYSPNYTCLGLIGYTGMDGAMIGITMPLYLSTFSNRFKKPITAVPLFLIPLTGIVLGRSSVALLTFLVSIATIFLFRVKRAGSFLCAGALLSLVVAVAVYFVGGPQLLDSSGRYEAYRLFMGHWYRHGDVFFGFGQGSFPALANVVQREFNFMPRGSWLWMHSDFLQIVFEQGVAGLVLILLLIFKVIKTLIKNKDVTHGATFASVLALASINYPFHQAPHAVFIAVLIFYILEK